MIVDLVEIFRKIYIPLYKKDLLRMERMSFFPCR